MFAKQPVGRHASNCLFEFNRRVALFLCAFRWLVELSCRDIIITVLVVVIIVGVFIIVIVIVVVVVAAPAPNTRDSNYQLLSEPDNEPLI